jgi:hypothetical protein
MNNLRNRAHNLIDEMTKFELVNFINNNWNGPNYLLIIGKDLLFYLFQYLDTGSIIKLLNICPELNNLKNTTYDKEWKQLLSSRLNELNKKGKFKYTIKDFEHMFYLYEKMSYFKLYLFLQRISKIKTDNRLCLNKIYGTYLECVWKHSIFCNSKKYRPVFLSKLLADILGYKDQIWLKKINLKNRIKSYAKYKKIDQRFRINYDKKLWDLAGFSNDGRSRRYVEIMEALKRRFHYSQYYWQVK